MPDAPDAISRWTRALTELRAQRPPRKGADGSSELAEAALTACSDLLRDFAGAELECERLRAELRVETTIWERLFDAMPGACLITDDTGLIQSANHGAAVMLNTSARHLKNRQLLIYSQDRAAFSALLGRLARGGEHVQATLAVRPRDRQATAVDLVAMPLSADRTHGWVWFLSPENGAEEPRAADLVDSETEALASD